MTCHIWQFSTYALAQNGQLNFQQDLRRSSSVIFCKNLQGWICWAVSVCLKALKNMELGHGEEGASQMVLTPMADLVTKKREIDETLMLLNVGTSFIVCFVFKICLF